MRLLCPLWDWRKLGDQVWPNVMFFLQLPISSSGSLRRELRCPAGLGHPRLCLDSCLSAYLDRTAWKRAYFEAAEGRQPDKLFIANTKPFQPVTPSTLAKWVLRAMEGAGIDTVAYKAHSSRSASASNLVKRGMSVPQIMERANWSRNSRTFSIFYNRA